ncbi:MAG: AAA family ATPase [Bacteroidetes bacterium]|nr:AAA family ATPase [Bacteroidota bacterium]
MKLLKLEINAFRGATQPFSFEFDRSKKLTMVFGENGTGKSTIADSITCLCTESLGSMSDKSGADKQFLVAIGTSANDVLLKLVTDGDEYSATLNSGKFHKNAGKSYPKLRQLRRSQIVKLIEAQPASRYEELKDYIDVESIMGSEDGLRRLVQRLEADLTTQTTTLVSASNTLEAAWINEGSPMAGWELWAEMEAGKDLQVEQVKVARIDALVSAWDSVERNISLLKEKEIATEEVAKRKAEHAINLEKFEATNQNINQDLITLLDSAGKFIQRQTELHECPLCSSPVEKEVLLDSIVKTVQSHSEYQQLISKKKTIEQEEKRAGDFLQSAQQTLSSALIALGRASKEFSGIERSRWEPWQQTSLPLTQQIELFQENHTALEQDVTNFKTERTKSQSSISQNNLIKSQLKAINENQKKAEETELVLINAKEALKIVETSRKEYIENELSSISEEVEAMYQSLHPNENIGGIQITLKPNVRKSLNLSASFQGQTDISPQSVYSESHLDTLGLCVFLSLAKKYGGRETILLLDDVVMSVDESHLDRFIDLLHSLSGDFAHILITTHYRAWRDRYRYKRAPEGEVHFIELRPWSLKTGIRHQVGKNLVQELQEAITSSYFDRQQMAAKAGILLENIFDYLTLTYSCKVRRKIALDYTLGELLDAISSKLSKSLRVEHLKKDTTGKYDISAGMEEIILLPLFDELKKLSFIRNKVGAHFNLSGSDVSDDDVENFAKTTLSLAQALICPESGDFPSKKSTGEYHETRSKSIRMHPFQEPT